MTMKVTVVHRVKIPREHELPMTKAHRLAEHWRGVRCCWPDWEGPIVTDDDTDPAGWCSVGGINPFSITHGETRYHYCAPCRIREILDGGNTLIVEIWYQEEGHCQSMNGEKLRLEGAEIWAPVKHLWAQRHAEELAEAIAEGKACECGGVPVYCYGGQWKCQPCRDVIEAHWKNPVPPIKKKPAAKKAAKKQAPAKKSAKKNSAPTPANETPT